MSDMAAALRRVREAVPYYGLRIGDGAGHPASDLRRPDVIAGLIDEMSRRIGTHEPRVAISTVFLGYASRLWCVAIGTALFAGRSIDLGPESLGWSSVDGTLTLHCRTPRPGGTPAAEVADGQLAPLVEAWSPWIAPGALWGNAASAVRGAGLVLGPSATPLVEEALAHPELADRLEPRTGRRRSCCLFYRSRSGSYCGDCALTSPTA